MQKHVRELVKLLESDGFNIVEVTPQKRTAHYKITLDFGTCTRFIIVSGSPSDSRRGVKNKLRDARHLRNECENNA